MGTCQNGDRYYTSAAGLRNHVKMAPRQDAVRGALRAATRRFNTNILAQPSALRTFKVERYPGWTDGSDSLSSSSSSLPGGLIAETKAGVRLGILSALVLPLRDYQTEDEKKRPVSVPEYAMGVILKRKKEAALIADMMVRCKHREGERANYGCGFVTERICFVFLLLECGGEHERCGERNQ